MKNKISPVKGTLLIGLLIVVGGVVWTLSKQTHISTMANQKIANEAATKEYWTCPMHPQVHLEHSGECPICHMKLVQVKAPTVSDQATAPTENRASLQLSDKQLETVDVAKTVVEKMDLTAHIPIAGRFISPSTVAFQVYESDLRYLKPGLAFTGESSLRPDSPLHGSISSIDSIVDPTSRTVRVVGSIHNSPQGIISETTFSGKIDISLKNVIGIPESSVLHTGTEDLVYLLHPTSNGGGHLMPTSVKLGIKTESYYEVLSGLSAGQTISSGPNFLIDSEAKIRGAGNQEKPHDHSHH
jgi:multidrug efflux pump subunit AcrA (membrane-fusion protein)